MYKYSFANPLKLFSALSGVPHRFFDDRNPDLFEQQAVNSLVVVIFNGICIDFILSLFFTIPDNSNCVNGIAHAATHKAEMPSDYSDIVCAGGLNPTSERTNPAIFLISVQLNKTETVNVMISGNPLIKKKDDTVLQSKTGKQSETR